MYNEEQKSAFLTATYPNEAKRGEIAGLFALFAPYEETWGIDLVLQHIDKLQPAFDEIVETITPSKAKRILLPALKKYRTWYLTQKPNAISTGVLLLKLNLEGKLRSLMVASPRHLKLIFDEVFESPERESLDCVYRALLWLAFAGVPRDRATLITVDEVDFENMQIHHGGKDYEIHAEGLKEFRKLCTLDYLVYIHRNPDYEQQRPRVQGDQLLRGYSNTSLNILKICNDMTRRFMPTKWALAYENVQACGLYYKKYELERIGQDVSFNEEAEERLSQMTESSEAALQISRNMMRSRYRAGYRQWKALFNVPEDA